MLRLLFLFIALPLVELALLLQLSEWMGGWKTFGLVLLTGGIGWWLAKREGLRTYIKIQQELGQGHLPGDHLVDALLILVAGVVLVTPGVITDAIGFLLLIPPVRAMVRKFLKKRFKSRVVMVNFSDMRGGVGGAGGGFGTRRPEDDFVDVEATEVRDEPTKSLEE